MDTKHLTLTNFIILLLFLFVLFFISQTIIKLLEKEDKRPPYSPEQLYHLAVDKFPDKKSFFFLDTNYLDSLNSSSIVSIEESLQELHNNFSVSIYVFCIHKMIKLNTTNKSQIRSFASQLFEFIKEDNYHFEKPDILILNSLNDKEVRIHTSSTIKSNLTDEDSTKIIKKQVGLFKEAKYHQAIRNILSEISIKLNNSLEDEKLNWISISIWSIIVTLMIIAISFKAYYSSRINETNLKKAKQKIEKLQNFLQNLKTNKASLNETCAICLDKMSKEQIENMSVKSLNCGHSFHKECIKSWIDKKIACPICRQQIDLNNSNNSKNSEFVQAVYRYHQSINNALQKVGLEKFLSNHFNIDEVMNNYINEASSFRELDTTLLDFASGGADIRY